MLAFWTGTHLDKISTEAFREIYETNVIGAFRVSKASLSLLQNSNNPLIVNISSRLGSISLRGHSQLGGAIAYQCSKAALNMLTAQMAMDYKSLESCYFNKSWLGED